jgi:hypothetical protein
LAKIKYWSRFPGSVVSTEQGRKWRKTARRESRSGDIPRFFLRLPDSRIKDNRTTACKTGTGA